MENNKLKSLRTLQTDIQEMEKKGVSFADIAAAAEKKGGFVSRERKKISLREISIIFFIIVIIVSIGVGSFLLFKKEKQKKEPVSLASRPILVSDQQVEASADLNSIQSALQAPIQINNLLYVSMAVKPAEFFKIIKANPPPELISSLDERFMLLKFYLSKEWPILLFKIRSYEPSFAGMIKWETSMLNDLGTIFSIPDGTGFSVEDKEIQNRDARMLSDEDGNPLLIYSFINRNYLIIAQNEEPIKEIFRRFSLPQYLNE